ncbi:MAG: hypothetical protein GXY32_11380, partial [Ruminococcaceae bacterium]|nr:hypothetical protein [Oscillospiraceae bacterium]
MSTYWLMALDLAIIVLLLAIWLVARHLYRRHVRRAAHEYVARRGDAYQEHKRVYRVLKRINKTSDQAELAAIVAARQNPDKLRHHACSKMANGHAWNGCRCARCGLQRDEQHDWNGCTCRICGKRRDEGHDWNGCTCRVCGK